MTKRLIDSTDKHNKNPFPHKSNQLENSVNHQQTQTTACPTEKEPQIGFAYLINFQAHTREG